MPSFMGKRSLHLSHIMPESFPAGRTTPLQAGHTSIERSSLSIAIKTSFCFSNRLLKKSICYVVIVARHCGVPAKYASFLAPRRLRAPMRSMGRELFEQPKGMWCSFNNLLKSYLTTIIHCPFFSFLHLSPTAPFFHLSSRIQTPRPCLPPPPP